MSNSLLTSVLRQCRGKRTRFATGGQSHAEGQKISEKKVILTS